MKLIIEISEEEYNEIKENKYGVFSGRVFETIRKGRPLPEEGWFPIHGKCLPEESGTYLVTMRANFFDETIYITTYAHYFARENQWAAGDEWEDDEIIAWKPLPEAYKESEEC